MDVFDLFAKITLDTKEYESGLSKAGGKLSAFGGFMAKGFGAVAKVGATALAGATTATAAFAKQSVDAATSFESAFTGVKKTVNATAEEYDQLADWIMDASTKMASSKEDIAGTMEIAGQLGISGVESLEAFTKTMVMLGDTTNLSSEEAASALARFMNITGDGAENVDKIGSAIVDLGNNFATTESDIVEMSTRLASAGTIAGLSATDILALATSMSSVGIQAEAGGTAMAQTLAKMGKAVDEGGEDLEDFAAVAGVSATEFAKMWKGEPIDAIQTFIQGLGRVNESDESVIMTLENLGLTGIRQTNMLQSLALASDVLSSAVETSNSAYQENIALQDEAEKRYGTTESAAMQTAEAFKNLKVVIGQELMPEYSNLMSFTQEAMKNLAAGMQEGGISGLFAAMGDALSAALQGIVEKLPEFIDAGMSLLGALGQGLAENVDTILGAISGVTTTILNTLVTSLEGGEGDNAIMRFLHGLGEIFTNNLDKLVTIGAKIIEFVMKGIADGAMDLAHIAVKVVSSLGQGLNDALPEIIPLGVKAVLDFIQGILQDPGKIWDAAVNIIQGLIGGIVNSIPDLARQGVIIIFQLANAIITAIPRIIEIGIDIIAGLIVGVGRALPAAIDGFLQMLGEIIAAVLDFFGIHSPSTVFAEIGNFLIEGLIGGIVEMIGDAVAAIGELGAAVIEGITTFFTDAWEGAKTLANEAWGAIKDTATTAWEGIKTAATTAWEGVKTGVTTLKNNVVTIFTNAKDGAVKAWDNVKSKFSTVWSNVKGAFSTAGNWFTSNFTNFKNNAVGAWNDIKSKFSTVWGNLKDAFNLGDALNWGKDLISNFIGGIKEKAGALKEELKGVADKVKSFLGFSEPEEGPLSDFHTYAPDMMELFAKGIRDNTDVVTDQIKKSFDFGGMIEAENSGRMGGFNAGGITINLYARDGQSASNIVDELEYRIAKNVEAKKAVWAM